MTWDEFNPTFGPVILFVMPEMDTSGLRARFRDFVGTDRYHRFVRTMNRVSRRKCRLLHWQEQLWDDFVSQTPIAIPSANAFAIFDICDIHGRNLQVPVDDSPLPEIRDTPEAEEASEMMFPFANNGDWICLDCRAARDQWIEDHEELCRILRCRTTYEDFYVRRFGTVSDFAQTILPRIKERSQEIAAQMKPGDELWEWDGGGWHSLSGRAGLAIIRNGRILQQWCEVKS